MVEKMSLVKKLISQIPSDLVVEQAVIGVYLAGVIASNGRMGLATVYPPSHRQAFPAPKIEPEVKGMPLKYLAEFAGSDHPLESALGVSALNAGLAPPPDKIIEKNARELIKEKARDLNLALIGHFPFTNEIAPLARQCWVVEREPQEDDLPEEATERVIKDAEVVVITASTLVNNTLEKILNWAKDKFVFLVGPSAPFSSILFELGVDVIAGAEVLDTEDCFSRIMLGYPFRALKKVHKVIWERK